MYPLWKKPKTDWGTGTTVGDRNYSGGHGYPMQVRALYWLSDFFTPPLPTYKQRSWRAGKHFSLLDCVRSYSEMSESHGSSELYLKKVHVVVVKDPEPISFNTGYKNLLNSSKIIHSIYCWGWKLWSWREEQSSPKSKGEADDRGERNTACTNPTPILGRERGLNSHRCKPRHLPNYTLPLEGPSKACKILSGIQMCTPVQESLQQLHQNFLAHRRHPLMRHWRQPDSQNNKPLNSHHSPQTGFKNMAESQTNFWDKSLSEGSTIQTNSERVKCWHHQTRDIK